MEYRPLGRTGVRVSPLCLGTMAFGAEADDATAAAMYRLARDAGINFFDTADVYAGGRSEEALGRLIAPERDQVILATKVHFPTGPDVNARGLSRRHIRLAVEASLRRLGTDRIDLLYAHGFDPATPIEEIVRALDDLVTEGKALYLGVSNWAAWQIATALGHAASADRARFQCIQPMYNIVKRQAEVEILPLAAAESMAVVSYSPLGGGLLSGKYGAGRDPAAGRLVDNEVYRRRYDVHGYRETVDRFVEHARERDVHPATLAVAWVLNHADVTAPILGGRTSSRRRWPPSTSPWIRAGTPRSRP